MRIDAHQHFWQYDPVRYAWIGEGMGVLARDFGPLDLKQELQAAGIGASIAVQARQDLDETDELLRVAADHDHVAAVVGWFDLESDELSEELDARMSKALVGARHILQDEPNDEYMLRPAFQRGIGELTKRRLSYDLLIHPHHLPVALDLVDAHPDQCFVLDHLAKPFIERGEIDPWRRDLSRLADRAQVSVKLSGLVTEAAWGRWTFEDLRPYLDAALEAFGATRVMFGSDWPVCTLAASYKRVTAVIEQWSETLSADEKAGLWGGNAARVYRLSESVLRERSAR